MSSLSPPSSTTRARSSSTAGNLTQARSRAATSSASPSSAQSAGDSSSSPQDRKGPVTQQQQLDPESPSSKPSAKMFNVLLTMSRVITQDALQLGGSGKERNSVDLTAAVKAGGGKVVTWEDEKKAAVSLLAAGEAIADRAADLVQQRRGQQQQQLQRTRLPPPSSKPRRAGHKRQPSPFSSLFISPPPLSPLPPPAVSSPRTSSFAGRFSPSSFHLPHLPSSSRPASPSSATPASPSSLLPPTRILLPIFFVCSLFFITLLPIVIGIWTLPLHSIKHLPRTVQDIKQVARELNEYASSGFYGTAHIFAVLAVTSVWKNAWSVPGSAVLNVLAGALMNPLVATVLQTLLTTIGSICSSLLSKPLAPVIAHVFPRAMSLTRSAFEGTTYTPVSSPSASRRGSVDDDDTHGAPIEETEKLLDPTSPISPQSPSSSSAKDAQAKQTPVWVRLTVLRLVGVVPWSALNLACGICDVPLWDCAIGGFIGMLPWTAVTCQIGDILQTVASSTASEEAAGQTLSSLLTSPSIIFKLVFLSLLSLGPVLLRDKLSELLSGSRKSASSSRPISRHPRRSDDSGSSTAYEEDLEEAEFEVREKL
ncbi:hypothetical protein FRC04_000024 [Tulasnella sp. 424]|nr:hypothetical protein FRC04_000024 [Tulasnella sp. 424]KAG8981888.1 hypothetical protein FRC05_000030 [Tulasnella sp. 425]